MLLLQLCQALAAADSVLDVPGEQPAAHLAALGGFAGEVCLLGPLSVSLVSHRVSLAVWPAV